MRSAWTGNRESRPSHHLPQPVEPVVREQGLWKEGGRELRVSGFPEAESVCFAAREWLNEPQRHGLRRHKTAERCQAYAGLGFYPQHFKKQRKRDRWTETEAEARD